MSRNNCRESARDRTHTSQEERGQFPPLLSLQVRKTKPSKDKCLAVSPALPAPPQTAETKGRWICTDSHSTEAAGGGRGGELTSGRIQDQEAQPTVTTQAP